MMDIKHLVESLHPLERKVIPYLTEVSTLKELMQKTGSSDAEVMRALQWLENKGALTISSEVKETLALDINGGEYLKNGLPERRFLNALNNSSFSIADAVSKTGLKNEEVTVCMGLLKKKAAINIDSGILSITEQGKTILSKEWLEEAFLKKVDSEQLFFADLTPEEKFAVDIFLKRKNIIKTDVEKIKRFALTALGKELVSQKISDSDFIDKLTQDMIKDGSWKGKSFRRYDVKINVPKIPRGKRHFVNQANEFVKKVWLDMGFKEMTGPKVNTCFWNFDALFTAQDHPVRDMQDTFYLKNPKYGKLPENKVQDVKAMHEHGGNIDSPGWQYSWDEDTAKRLVLRTHTTVLSAKTLASLKQEEWPAKFFAIGKNYRNEALDWKHLFEFNQTEGIVIDRNANFRNLLGYLKRFFAKMGFERARFRPAYFPYTEPSVEIDVLHPVHNEWVELGGAGIFRPEVVTPLLGESVPVLAWGPGSDRIMLEYYGIEDIRELFKNDLKQLHAAKQWMK